MGEGTGTGAGMKGVDDVGWGEEVTFGTAVGAAVVDMMVEEGSGDVEGADVDEGGDASDINISTALKVWPGF
jgi:hypothetical protein